jgi:hypothetical protein
MLSYLAMAKFIEITISLPLNSKNNTKSDLAEISEEMTQILLTKK